MLIAKKKDIFILGEDPTPRLDGTTLTAEKMYSINFTATKTIFCLILFLYLLMVQKVLNLKQKIHSEIVINQLCLEKISEEFLTIT